MPGFNRKGILVLALIAVLALLAVPLGAQDMEETEFIFAHPGPIRTLDAPVTWFISTHWLANLLYDCLIWRTVDGSGYVGQAAESWENVDDTTWRFNLRPGNTFHNGEPLDAAAVKWNIDRVRTREDFMVQPQWVDVAEVIVVDETTVDIKTVGPTPYFEFIVSFNGCELLPPGYVEEVGDVAFSRAPIGSGPYVLSEFTESDRYVFEAWDDYWGGRPAYDKIVWKIIPSPAERVQLLRTGVIDLAVGLGTEEFNALDGSEGVKVVRAPSKNMAYVGMNNSIAPFDDVAVRQAVSYGVDYDDILENVYKGDARRLHGAIPNGSAVSLGAEVGYTQDTAKAQEILASSSYDGGTVTLSIDSAKAEHQLIAVRVQSALREIGMDVEIETLQSPVFAERKVGKQLQMFVDELLAWIDDPNYQLSLTLESGVFGNYADYSNARVDEIITDGWAEQDPAARRAIFEEAQRLISEDAPWVFLAQPDFKFAMREDVDGFVLYPNAIPRFADLYPAG